MRSVGRKSCQPPLFSAKPSAANGYNATSLDTPLHTDGDEAALADLIGAALGLSQMHVSRLLTRCLNHLRTEMLTTD
ncbi:MULTISPECIES: sigma factor-like helix-turn-helix DNA-binding protein [unclassified Streptomyces]|uniref:sigma factor-like helix-turn-helix DNA-binding protein n=1 Tax=Streptomyces TaxID=1883 RepID=UPI00300E650A